MATPSDDDPVLRADAEVFRVESIAVFEERIEAAVRVRDPESMRTRSFPDLAPSILQRLPGLKRHRCESGSPHGIVAEIEDTELPHLLEHVALELMVLEGAPRTLRGETKWDFRTDGRGVFRVSLACADPEAGFSDPDMARKAMHDATDLIVELVSRGELRT